MGFVLLTCGAGEDEEGAEDIISLISEHDSSKAIIERGQRTMSQTSISTVVFTSHLRSLDARRALDSERRQESSTPPVLNGTPKSTFICVMVKPC